MHFGISCSTTIGQDKSEECARLGLQTVALTGGPEDFRNGLPSGGKFFYSQVENVGMMNPRTMQPGINLLPGMVVYNGNHVSIQEALAHYHSTSGLAALLALYLGPDSGLQIEDKLVRVVGGNGAVFFGLPGHPILTGSDICQLSPGDVLPRNQFPGL